MNKIKMFIDGLVILHLNPHSIRAIKTSQKMLKKKNMIGTRKTKRKGYFKKVNNI